MSEHTLILTVEDGRKWMSLNDRDHYRAKADKTKRWIKATTASLEGMNIPHMERATISGRIYKNRAGRYDPHNLFPTLKAIIDGIVRYGDGAIIEDDDYTKVEADLQHGGIDRTRPPHIVVTIREVKA